MPKPKASDWAKYEELLDAGTRGWNPMQRLPKLLEENFDWARDFTFGFFSEGDVPECGTLGWVHVRTDHFETDEFNKTVGTRFGLTDYGGVIKWRNNFLMMMPKDFRMRQMEIRHENYMKETEVSLKETAYAHPSDPEYAKMKAGAEKLTEVEGATVQVVDERGVPDDVEMQPKKRDWLPKKKE